MRSGQAHNQAGEQEGHRGGGGSGECVWVMLSTSCGHNGVQEGRRGGGGSGESVLGWVWVCECVCGLC